MTCSTHCEHHAAPQGERGIALIMAIIFTVIVMGITVSGSLLLKSNQVKTETNFVQHGQAVQFAKSGLTEALGWFRKQTAQPVLTFDPIRDLAADPQVLDTDSPEIGLAREWKITGAVWGRYEVWKEWAVDPVPERLLWREKMQIGDVSADRNGSGAGSVWKIRSIGYVFRRVDPNLAFDEFPNQVLGQEVLDTEIRRLTLQPPGQASLCSTDGNSTIINAKGRIRGGADGAGIFYPLGSGTPTTGPPAEQRVLGTPSLSPSATYLGSVEGVFGVTLEHLRGMSDQIITNAADFPNPVPTNSIIITDAPVVQFDASRPLMGTGVLYFEGDVVIDPGSNSTFSGLIYVNGNLTIQAPSEILGAIVCNGNVMVQGAADFATVTYDDDILKALRLEIGQYRFSSAFYRPLVQNN